MKCHFFMQCVLFCTLCLSNITFVKVFSQEDALEWKYEVGAKIESSVLITNDTIYVGSLDSTFYALDTLGQLIWKTKLPYKVKSSATNYNHLICVEAGNRLFGLNKSNGEQIWVHESDEVKNKIVNHTLDLWDLKSSSPALYGSTLYYGNQFGSVYGVNAETGAQEFAFNTGVNFAIRTKPAVVNDTLYFADFDGYVYAVNLSDESLIWSVRTYSGSKPYAEFGPVIGDMVIDGNNLFFGIRNHEFQVLNRKIGTLSWSYNSGGTWLSGIPLIKNDILYLGTSDTHELRAFNALTGEQLWKINVALGIYNAPVFYKDFILVAVGDEQMNGAYGEGRIMIVDLDGNLINGIALKGSVFNTPALLNNKIYFGSYDKHINCLDISKFLDSKKDSINSNFSGIDLGILPQSSVFKYAVGYLKNLGNDTILLNTSVVGSNNPSNGVILQKNKNVLLVQDSALLTLRINPGLFENGNYETTIQVKLPDNSDLNFDIPVSFTIESTSSISLNKKDKNSVAVYPNPVTDLAAFNLSVVNAGNGQILLYDLSGRLTESIAVELVNAGTYVIPWEATDKNIAIYRVVYNDELIGSGQLLVNH